MIAVAHENLYIPIYSEPNLDASYIGNAYARFFREDKIIVTGRIDNQWFYTENLGIPSWGNASDSEISRNPNRLPILVDYTVASLGIFLAYGMRNGLSVVSFTLNSINMGNIQKHIWMPPAHKLAITDSKDSNFDGESKARDFSIYQGKCVIILELQTLAIIDEVSNSICETLIYPSDGFNEAYQQTIKSKRIP